MQSVYYIIPTAAIGGAEKRFIELYCYLLQKETQFDFHLVVSEKLYHDIKENEQLYAILRQNENKTILYDIDIDLPILQFQTRLYNFVCEKTTSNDILHFILSFPTYVFPLKHKKSVYTLTESSLKNVNMKGRMLYYINAIRAKNVDILDPEIYKSFKRYFFFKKDRISLTPGSFVDTTVFKPVADFKKENWFVFLGRFVFGKQSMRLLQTLPEVCEKLDAAGIRGYKFIFLGYGIEEEAMHSIKNLPEFRNLPIDITKTNKPEEILAKSKVFFSLQLRNNYPSKSLLEGMAAGNIPLVTDVGSTRFIATPGYSYYVPESFSKTEIANQLIDIMSLDEQTLHVKMSTARDFIVNNFTIEVSANYYIRIYENLR